MWLIKYKFIWLITDVCNACCKLRDKKKKHLKPYGGSDIFETFKKDSWNGPLWIVLHVLLGQKHMIWSEISTKATKFAP